MTLDKTPPPLIAKVMKNFHFLAVQDSSIGDIVSD